MEELKKLTECDICFLQYDDNNRIPLMFNCGHCHCKDCVSKMLDQANTNCPTCRAVFIYQTVDDVPINYALMNIAKKLKENDNDKIQC